MSLINNEMPAIYSFIFTEALLIEKSFCQAQAPPPPPRDSALVYQQMISIQEKNIIEWTKLESIAIQWEPSNQ